MNKFNINFLNKIIIILFVVIILFIFEDESFCNRCYPKFGETMAIGINGAFGKNFGNSKNINFKGGVKLLTFSSSVCGVPRFPIYFGLGINIGFWGVDHQKGLKEKYLHSRALVEIGFFNAYLQAAIGPYYNIKDIKKTQAGVMVSLGYRFYLKDWFEGPSISLAVKSNLLFPKSIIYSLHFDIDFTYYFDFNEGKDRLEYENTIKDQDK